MATTERREVYSTRVVRTATGHPPDFDSNLDHLLEDLQSSVTRPALTNNIGGGGSSTSSRMHQVSAANPATVLTDGNIRTVYSSSSSSYNVSGAGGVNAVGGGGGSSSLDRTGHDHQRLDSLLHDLHHISAAGDGARQLQETQTRSVQRELLYDTDRTDQHAPASQLRNVTDGRALHQETRVQREMVYERDASLQHSPPAPVTEVVRSKADINPEILAQLDPGLLPPPNTRVTTTIKTYTYEIPAGANYPLAASPKPPLLDESAGDTSSHSFVYSSAGRTPDSHGGSTRALYTYEEQQQQQQLLLQQQQQQQQRTRTPVPVIVPAGHTQHHTTSYSETHTSSSSRQSERLPPRQVDGSPGALVVHKVPPHVVHDGPPPRDVNVTYNYRSEHTNSAGGRPREASPGRGGGGGGMVPPPGGRDVNITYKYTAEHTSTNSLRGRSEPEAEPLLAHPPPFPTDGGAWPPDTGRGRAPTPSAGPPKQLDELMAEIGREPPPSIYNAGYTAHQAEVNAARREHSQQALRQQSASPATTTTTTTQVARSNDMPKSKNVAGPPVYYPPGHELFAHKEESSAAAAASGGGGMMRESGKYKYEAKSSSKSKSSSGVAVVPVCLPLCCGLPCVII